MKSIAEINAIRENMQKTLGLQDNQSSDIRIVVGMATCGIAAGATPVFNAFAEEINRRNLKNVKVTQSGCLGMCKFEPMAQVFIPGKESVTYVTLTADIARSIVNEHIVNGNVVARYALDLE